MDWSKFNQFKQDIRNKNVLILGLGLQGGGVGATKFFHELGAKLRVTDLKTEEKLQLSLEKLKEASVEKFSLGRHDKTDVEWADLILINPDVPHDAEILKYALDLKKDIQMEEALFVKLCPIKDIIGITGTRGKTTTTMLIYELLKTQYPTLLGGNVAGSETLTQLFSMGDEMIKVVLELSSFQLYGFHLNKISPHIAVLTNIYEDHLNKYPSMNEYIFDKKAIYLYQNADDYLIINERYKENYHFIEEAKGKTRIFDEKDVDDYSLKLKGEHNAENYAASLIIARLFKIEEKKIKKVFADFSGVPFRQETIRIINGVTFINDTTSTTPTAAEIAIEAYKNKNFILIAGGNSKNCSDDLFAKKASRYAKKIILLKGNATDDFRKKLLSFLPRDTEKVSIIFDNFKAAVDRAFSLSNPGDFIILSPGFTSFGMFENEFDRGRQFNKIVQELF